MLPYPLAVAVDDGPWLGDPARALTQRIPVVATGYEADLLALGLVGRHEAKVPRDRPDLRLGEIAQRKPRMLQLVLPENVEEVGLVLLGITRPQEARSTVRADVAPGVVPGRDRLALVEVAGPPEQRPELDVRVAVDARRRRLASEIRVEERLHDAGIELALEVHDVERDVELRRHSARVIGGVERAAALLELGVRVGHVVQAHPDADDLVTLGVQQ